MRKATIGILILTFGLSWTACNKDNKPQIAVEEISPDRQKNAGRLIREKEVPLEVGNYIFMPIRSDKAVYMLDIHVRTEVKLQRFDFDLSRTASHHFKEGQGPGEWQAPPEFVGYDDNILMIDRVANRITWYDGNMNIGHTLLHRYNAPFGFVYSEMVKRVDGTFGLYYYLPSDVRMKHGYHGGFEIKIMGGTISPNGVDCEVYYEAFKGFQKENNFVFEEGEKILFAQAGDSLYIVDAETYTLTRMSLDGTPLRSVRIKTARPEFSKETLQKWYKGFASQTVDEHKGQWNPTYWYPSPLWPVAAMFPIENGLAVITCEDYNPENKPEMLRADYFDLDLNCIGVIEVPAYPFWNCPSMDNMMRARGYLRWQIDRLFYIDFNDEENPTLSRWRLE